MQGKELTEPLKKPAEPLKKPAEPLKKPAEPLTELPDGESSATRTSPGSAASQSSGTGPARRWPRGAPSSAGRQIQTLLPIFKHPLSSESALQSNGYSRPPYSAHTEVEPGEPWPDGTGLIHRK